MKLILFDIDNTLLKASKSHSFAFIEALKRVYKIKVDYEEFRRYNLPGMTDQEIIFSVLTHKGMKEEVIREKIYLCMEEMNSIFPLLLQKEELIVLPGVLGLLKALEMHTQALGIVTGNLEPIAWAKLKKANMASYFNIGAFGSDGKDRGKLVKLAIERACKYYDHSFSADVVYLVGDTPRDVMAGRKAGVKTIAVATGHASKTALKQAQADLVLDNLSELREVIIHEKDNQ